jgi:hypothetical protein
VGGARIRRFRYAGNNGASHGASLEGPRFPSHNTNGKDSD